MLPDEVGSGRRLFDESNVVTFAPDSDMARVRLVPGCRHVVHPSTLKKQLVYSSGIVAIDVRLVVKQSS